MTGAASRYEEARTRRTGPGLPVAQVIFVGHQQPAASPTSSACTSWTVSLYLLQHGRSYLLQQPPAGYQASYTACS